MVNFRRRPAASDYSSRYAETPTRLNLDEEKFDGQDELFPSSFTKGLLHNEFGQLDSGNDYIQLTNKINQHDADNFDQVKRGIDGVNGPQSQRNDGSDISWRGWESPRAGHFYELQGPDADAVGMPPAPELGSEELSAEMAEVYALALLRDIPFTQITNGTGADPLTGISTSDVLGSLASFSWFTDNSEDNLSLQELRRRAARRVDHGREFDINNPPDAEVFNEALAFRGSAPAAKAGPYVSQFMLAGNNLLAANNLTPDEPPYIDSSIAYGRQVIDQKIETLNPGVDFMVHWNAYIDVQNGANFTGDTGSQVIQTRRFITTPRDLAAYVRYDALYQAYLNACLIMLGDKDNFKLQQPVEHPYTTIEGPGFPDGNRGEMTNTPESRQAFATFGDPHILSLVTEVATRCLKAVRRQKFNYHRRARPERIGALLTLQATNGSANDRSNELGAMTATEVGLMLNQLLPKDGSGNVLPDAMLGFVNQHNQSRLAAADPHLDAAAAADPAWFTASANYLLPMAFAEGSPMHPSYGAGHATVAGGCVTMLKAFFDTTEPDGTPKPWPGDLDVLQASNDGSQLEQAPDSSNMTINGELNKLAANISIGRNMAGVHYYTDYYESLRMGERVAAGMLIEQMKHYNEPVEFSFESFDGDFVHIMKNDYDSADPRVFVHRWVGDDRFDVGLDEWWNRHVVDDNGSTQAVQFAQNSATAKATTKA